MKSKIYIIVFVIILASSYLLLSRKTEKIPPESTLFNKLTTDSFSRLNSQRRQLLSSALAHIRLGYTANRTPIYSTPPLLIVYSCKDSSNIHCGTLDERLIDITNSYFFSMLQQGSAFANDMTYPVQFDWYFEALPFYMTMHHEQAEHYLSKANNSTVKVESISLGSEYLQTESFPDVYTDRNISIVVTPYWQGNWMDMKANPSLKAQRDKFRLNHITLKSDWFWLSSRLLFSKPASGWFLTQLEPYRGIMGGKLQSGEGLSPLDPDNSISPKNNPPKWLRIGIRLTKSSTEGDAFCLASHAANVCSETIGKSEDNERSCHVFLSAPTAKSINILRTALKRLKQETDQLITIHSVSDQYPYFDLDTLPDAQTPSTLYQPAENGLKHQYARTFMDWIILSRMDYLIGHKNDGFLKTAAWAAQVQTDVKVNTDNNSCRIVPLADW
ncbi:hypothetical protein BDB01DRAFT_780164 [Pilobolus umbonatus]|nr:hypothetical protein BDB01DRAFT_780164 [Pilobolus umbonatus]